MFILEVDLAIFKRLTGYPLDAQGRPQTDDAGLPINREIIGPPGLHSVEWVIDPVTGEQVTQYPRLPSFGVRIPEMKAPYRGQRGLTSKSPYALPRAPSDRFEPEAFRQIPVFDLNLSGRKTDDIWPSVTFRWSGTEPENRTYIYHDPFGGQDVSSGNAYIRDVDGNVTATGYSLNYQRPHPESWNLLYEIGVHSKDLVELELICAEIVRMFPAKGAIVVTFQNGEEHACDMLLQRVDHPPMDDITVSPEEQRLFERTFVYLVEGYADNTTNQFGVQGSAWAKESKVPIRQRVLEIQDMMTELVKTQNLDGSP